MEDNNEDNNGSSNGSSFFYLLSPKETHTILLTMGIGGIASILVCLISLGMAMKFRLHRYLVHRLAIYQVASGFSYSFICVLQLVFINYNENKVIYHVLCIIEGFFMEYVIWIKLMFTFCLTFHLFCFAVFHVNFKKLELVYVLISVVGPLLFSWIPFIKETYGQAGAWCWIQNWENDNPEKKLKRGEIEQYALLYGPAIFCLLIAAVAVVIITVVLICRAYKCACLSNEEDDGLEPLLKKQQRKKVLREMLPLVAYPILSLVFYVPAFINRLVGSIARSASFPSFMWSAISLPLMGFLAGVTLIIHIFILQCPNGHNSQRQNWQLLTKSIKSETNIFTTETVASTNARSYYKPLTESEIDQNLNF